MFEIYQERNMNTHLTSIYPHYQINYAQFRTKYKSPKERDQLESILEIFLNFDSFNVKSPALIVGQI
jgi:hypothetical protein